MKSTNISRKKQFQLFKIEDFEEIRNDFCYRGDIFKLKNKKDDKIYASKIFTSQDIFMEFISKSNISQIDYPTIMKYYGIIPTIITDGYSSDKLSTPEKTVEFYADCVKTYFVEGDVLDNLCHEIYKAISDQLGGDYGNSYSDNIGYVLSN